MKPWNPVDNDDDAKELARLFGITISIAVTSTSSHEDPYAAVRRAIVKTAEGMEKTGMTPWKVVDVPITPEKECGSCLYLEGPLASTVCSTCHPGCNPGYYNWTPKNDPVKSPSHYQLLPGVEVIHVRKALLDKMPNDWTPYQIDCWSRAWEYITRAPAKNGLEDLKKGQTYLNWLIEDMEGK